MRAFWALAGAGLFLAAAPVNAASLCNCCVASMTQDCSAACASAKPVAGQCAIMVDYGGQPTIAPGENPLYGISLLGLSLEDATKPQLEAFRKLLENSRRGLEKDRKASLQDFRKHRIDAATAQANGKRYEDAIINYYLGLRAYRDRLAAAP